MRFPGVAVSQASTRIIWSRGKARITRLWSAPKPLSALEVVNGKYMHVSSTKHCSAPRSTK